MYYLVALGIVGRSVKTGERIYTSAQKLHTAYASVEVAETERKRLVEARIWKEDELDIVEVE